MATNGEGIAKAAAAPPYLSYPTFQNFLNGLRAKGGAPGRIDRSVLVQFSGGIQSQLIAALRYLGLAETDGTSTGELNSLVVLDGQERTTLWQEIMKRSYPFLFDGSFPLQTATSRQIEEKFNSVATGDTVRKCMAFFLLAAKDAGIQLSPFIKAVKVRRNTVSRGRRQPSSLPINTGAADTTQISEARSRAPEVSQNWSQMLLAKFPNFDPAWPDDVKAKWFEAFDKLMKQGH
jgi:hypothetical protein